MIPQMEPVFGEEEAKAVYDYMREGGWLTEYRYTDYLERLLSAYLDVEHVVMMPSGTMALYAALSVLDIGLGDHVFVPAMTMIATANAVTMTGATIRFADIEPRTLCMDLSSYSDWRCKALIYVSLNGRSGNMDEVRAYCAQNNLWLIEDAAQSLGSTWRGRALGTFGDIGCFSLSCQKIITTGNGGFCVTNNEDLAQRLRMFKNFGRLKGGVDEYLAFGTNLKFTDLQAVIGIEQMKKLPDRVRTKKIMWDRYCDGLSRIRNVEIIPTSTETAPWFMDILADDRDDLADFLKLEGVGTRKVYPVLNQTPVYPLPGRYSVAERVAERGLWLPSSVSLYDDDIDYICGKVREFYD